MLRHEISHKKWLLHRLINRYSLLYDPMKTFGKNEFDYFLDIDLHGIFYCEFALTLNNLTEIIATKIIKAERLTEDEIKVLYASVAVRENYIKNSYVKPKIRVLCQGRLSECLYQLGEANIT